MYKAPFHFVKRIKLRQHINPLSHSNTSPIILPNWADIYENAHNAYHVDIGCRHGDFIFQLAQKNKNINYLGLEVKGVCVVSANDNIKAWNDGDNSSKLQNIHYLKANGNVHLEEILKSLPSNAVKIISIFHPDPHFKASHRKRRLINEKLILDIMPHLNKEGSLLFFQSDVKNTFEDGLNIIKRVIMNEAKNNSCKTYFDFQTDIHHQNLFGIETERERFVNKNGGEIYRVALLLKKNVDLL